MHSWGHPPPRMLPSRGPYAWCPQICPPSCLHHHPPPLPWHSCLLLREQAAASPRQALKHLSPIDGGTQAQPLPCGVTPEGLGHVPTVGHPHPVPSPEGAAPKQWVPLAEPRCCSTLTPRREEDPGVPATCGTAPSNPSRCWWQGGR